MTVKKIKKARFKNSQKNVLPDKSSPRLKILALAHQAKKANLIIVKNQFDLLKCSVLERSTEEAINEIWYYQNSSRNS